MSLITASVLPRAAFAGRRSLITEELAESVLLLVPGVVIAAGVARLLTQWLAQRSWDLGSGVALVLTPLFTGEVLLGGVGALALAFVVFGVIPALKLSSLNLQQTITADVVVASPRWRWRRVLIAVQVAASVLLAMVAFGCLQQARAYERDAALADLSRLAVVRIDATSWADDHTRAERGVDMLLDRGRRIAGIEQVAVMTGLPTGRDAPPVEVQTIGDGAFVTSESRYGRALAASPEIFDVLGLRVLGGRRFAVEDATRERPVVILPNATALTLFRTSDAVGRGLLIRTRSRSSEGEAETSVATVVGVVEDDPWPAGRGELLLYTPYARRVDARTSVIARVAPGRGAEYSGVLRDLLRTVDPQLPVVDAGAADALVGPPVGWLRLTSLLTGVLAAAAFALALIGLFGVLSQVVVDRTWEFGIRMALGASRAQILQHTLVEGLTPVVLGLIAGVGGAVLVAATLQPFVTRLLPAADSQSILAVSLVCMAVAACACYLPARWASRSEPNVALRRS